MSDLLAECDWHDSTLFLVLPEDPERIGVRLFPSRHAPSRLYVPEAEIVRTKAENAKLRELVRDLYGCVSHANEQDWFYFERHMLGCGMSCTVNGEACGLSVFADRMKELGVDDG